MDADFVMPQRVGKPKRPGPGRPKKRLIDGPRKAGRPRRYEREEGVEPRERLRAPKTRFVVRASDRQTRSASGTLETTDYRETKTNKRRGDPPGGGAAAPRRRGRPRARPPQASEASTLGREAVATYGKRARDPRSEDDDDEPPRKGARGGEAEQDTREDSSTEGDFESFYGFESGDDPEDDFPLPDVAGDDQEEGAAAVRVASPPRPSRDAVTQTEPSRDAVTQTEPSRDAVTQTEPSRDAVTQTEPSRDAVTQTEPSRDAVTQTEPFPEPETREERATSGSSPGLHAETKAILVQRDPKELIQTGSDVGGVRALYWSAENEENFRRLWATLPPGSLDQGDDGGVAEVGLWKTMLVCFNATPPQLFTYGPRPHGAHVSDASLCLRRDFCEALEMICTHPLWNGDLDKLRYVLQKAVALTIRDHVEPIGPLPGDGRFHESTGIVTPPGHRDRLVLLGMMQYTTYVGCNPGTARDVRPVVEALSRSAGDMSECNELRRTLFLLCVHDLYSVIEALDGVRWPGRHYPDSSVELHNERFHRYYAAIYDRISPRGPAELRSLIWLSELSEKRDAEIRRAISDADVPGEFLLDGPSLGPWASEAPLYEKYAGLDPRITAILRGNLQSPKRVSLAVTDNRFRGCAIAAFSTSVKRLTNGPTNRSADPHLV